MKELEGQVALVTGGSRGIGLAIAQELGRAGAKVAVVGRNGEAAESAAASLEGAGHTGLACDVSQSTDVKRVVGEIEEDLGPIDILVNNAGIVIGASLARDEQSDEEYEAAWARTLDVLLTAHVRLVRACLPQLSRNGEGRIINIASTEGLGASAGTSPYTAAKHGVVGLTRSMAVELGAKGVTVNCICPGPIVTGMTESIPEEMRNKFARRRVPLRRYGDPEEVAHATLSLALPASSYLNGVVLPVDGGMTIQNT